MKKIGMTDAGEIIVLIKNEAHAEMLGAIETLKKGFLLLGELMNFSMGEPISPVASVATKGVSVPRTPAVTAAKRQATGEKRDCLNCGKPFTPKTKRSRFCKKACIDQYGRTQRQQKASAAKPEIKVRRPAKQTSENPGNGAPLYRIVQGLLSQKAMSSSEIVTELVSQGFQTTVTRIGVMLCTYKKLFTRSDGKKWTLAQNPGRVVQKESASRVVPDPDLTEEKKQERLNMLRKLSGRKTVPYVAAEQSDPSPRLDDIPEFQRAKREAMDGQS